MPIRLSGVLAIVLVVSGCASFGEREAYARKLEQILTECRTARGSGGYAGEAACGEKAIRRLYLEGEYPYMDLVDLYLAQWLAIARQVDQGRLRVDEGHLQLKEQLVRLTNEATRRDGNHNDYRFLLLGLRPSLLD